MLASGVEDMGQGRVAEDCCMYRRRWQEEVCISILLKLTSSINQRTLSALGLMGVYQDGYAKNTVPSEEPGEKEVPVTAHIFEYTTQITIDETLKIKYHYFCSDRY